MMISRPFAAKWLHNGPPTKKRTPSPPNPLADFLLAFPFSFLFFVFKNSSLLKSKPVICFFILLKKICSFIYNFSVFLLLMFPSSFKTAKKLLTQKPANKKNHKKTCFCSFHHKNKACKNKLIFVVLKKNIAVQQKK